MSRHTCMRKAQQCGPIEASGEDFMVHVCALLPMSVTCRHVQETCNEICAPRLDTVLGQE